MMKRAMLIATTIASIGSPAGAATLSKSYSYFYIGGTTLEEIEAELSKRGPHVSASNSRHPGATQMQFTTQLAFTHGRDVCQIVDAKTTVSVKVILPKWRRPHKADSDVRLVWDVLASDIKRHEESHVVIAKNYGRELEQSLKAMGRQKNCEAVSEKAKTITADVLARHEKAQAEFDRVEGKNFESRIVRLLRYRLEQMAGHTSHPKAKMDRPI
jgi:predicted secreted Zn-dependent protease